jgi:hypothetical protein
MCEMSKSRRIEAVSTAPGVTALCIAKQYCNPKKNRRPIGLYRYHAA